MCYEIRREYSVCRHVEQFKTHCKDYYHHCSKTSNLKPQEKEKKGKGFFQRLFSFAKKVPPPVGFQQILGSCPVCMEKQERNKTRHGRFEFEPQKTKEEVEANARNANERHHAKKQAKETFRCSRCTAEGRRIETPRYRAVNNGLCCARGIEEWRAKERRFDKSIAHASTQPGTQASRVEQRHEHGNSSSVEAAREAGRNAAIGYGWTREQATKAPARSVTAGEAGHQSAMSSQLERGHRRMGDGHTRDARQSAAIEKGLIRDFIKLPGTSMDSIPLPPHHYNEPGIDWKQWEEAPQGPHGRYPAPGPVPSKPLPPPPPRTKHLVPRKEVPQAQGSTEGRTRRVSRDIASRSPLTSPHSMVSPVSPDRHVRWQDQFNRRQPQSPRVNSVASRLDLQLDDALNYWRQV